MHLGEIAQEISRLVSCEIGSGFEHLPEDAARAQDGRLFFGKGLFDIDETVDVAIRDEGGRRAGRFGFAGSTKALIVRANVWRYAR